MSRCVCQFCKCSEEATTTLEAQSHGSTIATAKLCAPCKAAFLAGWEKMQQDERALLDQGETPESMSLIMSQRVKDGVYDSSCKASSSPNKHTN